MLTVMLSWLANVSGADVATAWQLTELPPSRSNLKQRGKPSVPALKCKVQRGKK